MHAVTETLRTKVRAKHLGRGGVRGFRLRGFRIGV